MKKKIFFMTLITVALILFSVVIVMLRQMDHMREKLIANNQETGSQIEEISENAMSKQTHDQLTEMCTGKANQSNGRFSEFQDDICIIANTMQNIYDNPGRYGEAKLKKVTESDMGNPETIVAYATDVDPDSESLRRELSKIAVAQGTMKAVHVGNDSMSSDYFATETGIFLGNEIISDINIATEEKPLTFDAKERPWYIQAVEKGEPAFTGIMKDADSDNYGITCGVPVYSKGKLAGVAGGGMYLSSIQDEVGSFRVGQNGYSCIVNNLGQVLFSGAEEGEPFFADGSDNDIRETGSGDISELVKIALSGKNNIRLISYNDESYYVAYAPMETVGWTYIIVLPEEEVLEPTKNLLASLNESNDKQVESIMNTIMTTVGMMILIVLIVGIVAGFLSYRQADRITKPIEKLTDSVRNLQGDQLDFKWDLNTGDEVQTLAEAFVTMTGRMKQYIKDITEITAEKERIGAELSVATNIQASMLPCIFPPFPNRKEFDLYAKMDPAKEVGGDFYDFFFIDDDHLALVMADVSGKGIPAALFMVIAKTLIKNHAQLAEKVEDVFANSNNQLCEGNGEELFVTAWLGVVDLKTGVMQFCDAGHENPYILHEDGTVEALLPPRKKPPLATLEGLKYIPNETVLKKGDCLFLYTDGVPEATNSGNELYGTDRLEKILAGHTDDSAETLLTEVRADVDAFVADAPQFDDLTMLAFRLKSLEGESVKDGDENA
ncbi:MAG: SpoIIE family protein phosphatase [Lachnospiraceae bacterium]|nr:SpoIIE family protein phosphatase [Lachnospiraceae bacterium]